jgi:hypothetical protein
MKKSLFKCVTKIDIRVVGNFSITTIIELFLLEYYYILFLSATELRRVILNYCRGFRL